MANTRIRVDADIENYLKSQSERVMGISPSDLSSADLTTLTNRIIYEHKLAQTMMRQEFLPRVFSWLKGILPSSKVVPIDQSQSQKSLPEPDLDFAADFASQFEEAA